MELSIEELSQLSVGEELLYLERGRAADDVEVSKVLVKRRNNTVLTLDNGCKFSLKTGRLLTRVPYTFGELYRITDREAQLHWFMSRYRNAYEGLKDRITNVLRQGSRNPGRNSAGAIARKIEAMAEDAAKTLEALEEKIRDLKDDE